MSNANGTLTSRKDTSTLVRAVFEPGMLLQHEDLDQLNAYTRDLSRLLFRSFFGCGVVCGLVVKPDQDKCGAWHITVHSGLALDCNGDPIYVPKDQYFALADDCAREVPATLWVVLCGFSKLCGKRTSMCSPDDEDPKSICARQKDWFDIRVVTKKPECACGWADADDADNNYEQKDTYCKCVNPDLPCYRDHYKGNCTCDKDDCCCSGCDCVLLAKLERNSDDNWTANHRVRRFIRPVLMRDPEVESRTQPTTDGDTGGVTVVEAMREESTPRTASKKKTKARSGNPSEE